ncbi:MAG: spore maturation protein [Oscillospiraceae bacterium]
MTSYVIPLFMIFVVLYGVFHKVDVFKEFLEGAKEGIKTSFAVLPALIALVTCVGMFKASGGLDLFSFALKNPFIPQEIIPLALLRPISGSGALVIFEDILRCNGPDSFIGRLASVLMGSTETTFYTIAIYYGSVGINKTRHTVICGLIADITSFIAAIIICNIVFKL